MVKEQKKLQKDNTVEKSKNSSTKESIYLQFNESDQNLQYTSIHLGEPKPPKKNQTAIYKVPETDLNMDKDIIEIYTKLPGIKSEDVALSLNKDTYIIKCSNKNVAYYAEIKLPGDIVPQSALSYFKEETLYLKLIKMKESKPWDGILKMQTLLNNLQETKERLTKFQEQYQAIQLEYQNILVRSKKELETKIDNHKISIFEKVLRNIDNFELALNSINRTKNKENEQITIGINLILNDLMSMLKEEGVTEILSKGMILDPNQHEVIDVIETKDFSENIILEEVQKGYKYKNRIIRPSKVKVSKLPNKDTKKGKSKKKK